MMCVDYENYLKRGPADMCKYAGYALGGEGALKEITYSTDHASVIALLDTCRVSVTNDSRLFRGPAAVGNGESTKLTVDTPAGTALLQCYACGHLAAAQDGGEDGNGMYTKHLLQVRQCSSNSPLVLWLFTCRCLQHCSYALPGQQIEFEFGRHELCVNISYCSSLTLGCSSSLKKKIMQD